MKRTRAALLTRSCTLSCSKPTPTAEQQEKHAALSSQRLSPYAGKIASADAMASFRDPRRAPVGEPLEALRRRVQYQSQYRGMVEMDVVLGSFVKKYLHTLTATELTEYDVILKQFDNDLFNWLLMGAAPQEQVAALSVWTKIFNHVAENRNELIGYRV